MSMNIEKIILGDEYDDALRDALRIVLVKRGAVGVDKTWGVGGSQEIDALVVRLGSDLITVEAETFVDLKNTVSDYIFHSRKCSLTPFFAGASSEQVARQLHQMRRDLG
ncbi:hypothetical protein RAS14_16535, partial [Achromobacter aegrifaciens]